MNLGSHFRTAPSCGGLLVLLVAALGLGNVLACGGEDGNVDPDVEDVSDDTPPLRPTPDTSPRDVPQPSDTDAEDADTSDAVPDTRPPDPVEVGPSPDVPRPPDPTDSFCGDGVVDEGEECDDGNDIDDDTCSNACVAAVCGDGVINETLGIIVIEAPVLTSPHGATGYVCDDGATCPELACVVYDNPRAPEHGVCQSLGYERAVDVEWGGGPGGSTGTVPRVGAWECFDYICGPGEETSAAATCGPWEMLLTIACEGIVREECDFGDDNGMTPDTCRPDCTLPRCGDGVVDTGEECDDGNTNNFDGCRNDCTLPFCGDGITDSGEECDDGNDDDSDFCLSDCTLPVCGDGIVSGNEDCDLGDENSDEPNAECRTNCRFPRCGDGIVDDGEECDDGNSINNDGCTNACTLPVCGDGIVQEGEECDDGNDDDSDFCLSDCTLPVCGDGIVSGNEDCDLGDENSDEPNALCRLDCTVQRCGDGVIDDGEECDLGAENDDRGVCKSDCSLPFCGDGIVQRALGEECDDGNNVSGDGCDADCFREPGAPVGHVFYIGHDFFTRSDAIDAILGNAVALDMSRTEIRVLAYVQYANATEGREADASDDAIRARLSQLGYSVVIDRFANYTLLDTMLDGYDVLLVYEQSFGGISNMITVGQEWRNTVETFVDRGGTFIVLDHLGDSWRLLNATGHIRAGSSSTVANGVDLSHASTASPVLADVPNPYPSLSGTRYLNLSADNAPEVTPLVVTPSSQPVVIHRRY